MRLKKIYFKRTNLPEYKVPYLIEYQKKSYGMFLQKNVPKERRKRVGIQAAFSDIFPITNQDESIILEFVDYEVGEPKFSPEDCKEFDLTYSVSLWAKLRLIEKRVGGKEIVKEQDVYICDIPYMLDTGSFIYNGKERVVVTQIHRSPGVTFDEGPEKVVTAYGKKLYTASIIPYRGSWMEFEFDLDNAIWGIIDKKKKFPATQILRASGLETNEEIIKIFYKTEEIKVEKSSGRILAEDIYDPDDNKKVLFEAGTTEINDFVRERILKTGKDRIKVISEEEKHNVAIIETIKKDKTRTFAQAVSDIFRRLRAFSDFAIEANTAKEFWEYMFFKPVRRYDLSKVGRYRINKKLAPIMESFGFEIPKDTTRNLTLQDIVATLQYLIELQNEVEGREIDDIDHLGSRRVRGVGELLENQLRIGLAQAARITREKMLLQRDKISTPRELFTPQPVQMVMRRFFGTFPLSQFMQQTNPLDEITHKRRLSATGPGGLQRKRAGPEVRDVHHSHYGRICPIETPEGANIGLITSLAIYARINEYGLIETPYRKVENGKITDKIEYLTADEEENYTIAPANVEIDKNGKIVGFVVARRGDQFPLVEGKDIDYIDASAQQLVGLSAGLIPFLEHDDANRALMGSNMQRQAVPLLKTEPSLVATGLEEKVARDSGAVVISDVDGIVLSATSDSVVIKTDDGKFKYYKLVKFGRSNQDTAINQRPLVKRGDRVRKGDIIVDGMATSNGEIALGKNLLVAFMSWEGYNYEDAIIISERLLKEDILTSVHIFEEEIEARETKVGAEEITRDIGSQVPPEALRHLDENGIVQVGSRVKVRDVLVGKVVPQADVMMTPEERLLQTLFGKKAGTEKDESLKVPPGEEGVVIDVKVFSRKGKVKKKELEKRKTEILEKYRKLRERLRRDTKNEKDILEKRYKEREISKKDYDEEVKRLDELLKVNLEVLDERKKHELENLQRGEELPAGVVKKVKVKIASRRKIQIGDKLAGRHGNKGVISVILPEEDMPYLPDGTPIDVIISPLSVPSRMNVGQILELMLGWAAKKLNVQCITPVFIGATEEDVKRMLREAGLPEDGRITLIDGRTGEPFKEKVTVGYMYIMKLEHMAEDKIHARATGPYSLVTQQPLGGRAQYGGQRFGEMEVWAIEGYGASRLLEEFLTIKSDDVEGRKKVYEAIIKGEPIPDPGIPQSFQVLIKELQALGLKVELLKEKRKRG
ncbi:MAG: DNA-directed RNA polymerase subunit beta [Caldiserica bacterium]|nr:MAG: DNA-directed RNA polymerase subunit beta [Caldisericota bacterium]